MRWNSKAAPWNFRSLERVRWRHHCWYWWQGTAAAPVKFFTTWTLSLGMLPGFTDLQCKGLCFNVSQSFSLGFKGGRLSFFPPQCRLGRKTFHPMAFGASKLIQFFFVDVQTCTNWDSVQHQINWSLPLFFFNNWILFLLASCVNSEVVHSSGSLYYDHLKHSSWPGWMIRWI